MNAQAQRVDVLAVMDRAINARPRIDVERAKQGRCGIARDLLEARAAVAELIEATMALRKAEWMVTHDWGGDRDSVNKRVDDALAPVSGGAK